MLKKKSISVIVTVHNSALYLRECLDSLINQTFSDFEVLCIDGGSIDESPIILEEYSRRDRRIRIVRDSNTSYGHKVNRGIELAQGEYLAVLESDDFYDSEMLDKLWTVADEKKSDIVNGSYEEFFNCGAKRFFIKQRMYSDALYNRVIVWNDTDMDYPIIPRYWTGIFRKAFLVQNNIRFNESEGAAFQDMSFRFLTTVYAGSTYHIPDTVYYYRIDNLSSSMNDPKRAIRIVDEFSYLKSVLRGKKETDRRRWKAFYEWKYGDFHAGIARSDAEVQNLFWKRFFEEYGKDFDRIEDLQVENKSVFLRLLQEKGADGLKSYFGELYESNRRRKEKIENFLEMSGDKQIVVIGSGIRGKNLCKSNPNIISRVACFADNSPAKIGTKMSGISIMSPQEAYNSYPDAYYFVAIKEGCDEVISQLKEIGISEDRIVDFWK